MVKVDGLWVHQGSAEAGANWEAHPGGSARRADRCHFENVTRVDIFFDTTVLVAASEQSHPHYARARPTLVRVAGDRTRDLWAGTRSRKLFAALTRLESSRAYIRLKRRGSSLIS